jgi:hypothetical protein
MRGYAFADENELHTAELACNSGSSSRSQQTRPLPLIGGEPTTSSPPSPPEYRDAEEDSFSYDADEAEPQHGWGSRAESEMSFGQTERSRTRRRRLSRRKRRDERLGYHESIWYYLDHASLQACRRVAQGKQPLARHYGPRYGYSEGLRDYLLVLKQWQLRYGSYYENDEELDCSDTASEVAGSEAGGTLDAGGYDYENERAQDDATASSARFAPSHECCRDYSSDDYSSDDGDRRQYERRCRERRRARERLEHRQRLEQLEQQRLEQQQQRRQLEQERLERWLRQRRLEQDRLEQQQQQRRQLEQERLEHQQRLEQLEQQRLEQQQQQRQLEQERLERWLRQRQLERLQQIELEKLYFERRSYELRRAAAELHTEYNQRAGQPAVTGREVTFRTAAATHDAAAPHHQASPASSLGGVTDATGPWTIGRRSDVRYSDAECGQALDRPHSSQPAIGWTRPPIAARDLMMERVPSSAGWVPPTPGRH